MEHSHAMLGAMLEDMLGDAYSHSHSHLKPCSRVRASLYSVLPFPEALNFPKNTAKAIQMSWTQPKRVGWQPAGMFQAQE